jgi:geranylgeranyl diphosphate synthase type II
MPTLPASNVSPSATALVEVPTARFQESCRERRTAIDAALDRWLPREPECPAKLAAAMRYAVLSGGKRVRPLLALMSCAACGGVEQVAMPAACALECIHAYSLIHDDLPALDNDDLRRGRPTVHKAFDEATAILAGDALLTLAFELLSREIADPAAAAACVLELSTAAGAAGMVGGQADDLAGLGSSHDRDELLSRLEAIHARKTGALFLASVRMGAISAGAGDRARRAIEQYGRRIGLVFQIVDDILDHEQDAASTPDAIQLAGAAPPSFPELLGLTESRLRAEQLVSEACDALEPLGPRAEHLRALAHFILKRTE